MKKIFDWMREQIESKCNYEPVDYDYCDMSCSGEQGFIAKEDVLDVINEAEAKREEDCCEWVFEKELVGIPIYKTCHKTQPYYNDGDKKFCTYCGKPIKISEVE